MATIPPSKSQQRLMVPPQQPQQLQQMMAPPQDKNQQSMLVPPTAPPPRSPVTAASKRMTGDERHMFTTSDDNVMMKQILATHAHDGREVDVRPLLQLIDDIFQRSTSTTLDGALHHQDPLASYVDMFYYLPDMLGAFADTVHKISCEISCECSEGGGDAHSTTVALFNTLSSYSWNVKVVLTLAAFAVTYGEYWLMVELYCTDPSAKFIALLKYSELLRPRFEALRRLIKAMVEVTKCVVEFNELPTGYISPNQPSMLVASTQIPTAVYWTVRSVVACASQIIGLIGLGHEYIPSTNEASEFFSLADNFNNIHNHLHKQLALCHQHIDEKKHAEAYQTLVRLFETIHIDNMKILRALINAKDDLQLLVDGTTKKRVGIEVLRRRTVLLLISDLDMPQEELSILDQMYKESLDMPTRPESQYEVMWLPVVDKTLPWTNEQQGNFERLQSKMPWYSITHPSLIDPAVIKYIKEVWLFNKKTILVVLDPNGRVVNPNALHMMWIWGSFAFPFTSMREEALWREETWRLELLVDGIDPHILTWIAEERFICLYGGEDTEWIRKFTTTARGVAQAARLPFEMVYVGKSNPKERVRRNVAVISTEKLSSYWEDLMLIWFFWVRLESMLYSKMQQGRTIENDRIMSEVMTMLTFDGSKQGWALISKGSANMVKAKGDVILTLFQHYDLWRGYIDQKGFMGAIDDHLQVLHTPKHCVKVFLPDTLGRIPEMDCAECGSPMEKSVLFRCCTD